MICLAQEKRNFDTDKKNSSFDIGSLVQMNKIYREADVVGQKINPIALKTVPLTHHTNSILRK